MLASGRALPWHGDGAGMLLKGAPRIFLLIDIRGRKTSPECSHFGLGSANIGAEEFSWRCPHGTVRCERAALLLPVSTLVMAKTKYLLSFLSRCSLRQESTASLRDQTGLSAALLFTFGKTSPSALGHFPSVSVPWRVSAPGACFLLGVAIFHPPVLQHPCCHGEHTWCSAAQTPLLHRSRRARVKEE